jgi:hypothetical protein
LLEGEPEKIVVFGAGLEVVNGEYIYASRSETDHPRYEMQTMLDGKSVTCTLDESPWGENKNWCICLKNAAIFCSNTVFSKPNLPPHRGWWSLGSNYSKSPSPKAYRPPILIYGKKEFLDWRHDSDQSFADHAGRSFV